MNRNVESHFSELPSVDIQRSMMDLSSTHKTSFNVGELIPFYLHEVIPGGTYQVTTSLVARLQTLLTPIMDNVYLDTYFFFVPNRLVWSHWKEFMGENTESAWMPQTQYTVPKITIPEGGFAVGTIADYLGVPTGVRPSSPVNLPMALPFRGYALICNEWFRDQNLSDPVYVEISDAYNIGTNGSNYITDVGNGGKPFKVAKYHDYFTSCLPSPQKSDPVSVSFASIDNMFPVGTLVNTHADLSTPSVPMRLRPQSGVAAGSNDHYMYYESSNTKYRADSAASPSQAGTSGLDERPVNLWAKVSYSSDVTINELRLAFQLQKFYEKNARGGTRYRELLLEHFGVRSPDARMMVPEYLGGHRIPLQIHQVTNQMQGENDFLGDLGAMSNTADVHDDFIYSSTEHGFIFGLCCVRYDHSYPQGLERMWSRQNPTDYYWPVFANIGEQPVKVREIYLDNEESNTNDLVFGYQEAWAEYRYKPSRVSGEMRPGIQNSLASWHLSDYYTSRPFLSDAWIREDKNTVDRVLAVSSQLSNQVFCDFYVKNIATLPMPVYSIPGLVDHH